MSSQKSKNVRILAVAPSTRGFGFAVVESGETLVDWGVKTIRGEKNRQSLGKVKELIEHYEPGALAIPDAAAGHHRRSSRIQELCREIIDMAKSRNIKVALLSKQQISRALLGNNEGTKHAVAETLAERFPDELGFLLPPKRRPWMSEDYRMDIFSAVSIALTFCFSQKRRP